LSYHSRGKKNLDTGCQMSVSSPALPGWYKHFTEKYRQARCWQGDYACWLNPGDHDGWWSCQTKNCLCPTILGLSMEKSWKIHVLGFVGICCLVVWNMNFIFPFIGNNDPNWLFFRGVATTNQFVRNKPFLSNSHDSYSVTIPSSNRDPEDHPEIPMKFPWIPYEITMKSLINSEIVMFFSFAKRSNDFWRRLVPCRNWRIGTSATSSPKPRSAGGFEANWLEISWNISWRER